MILNIIKKNGLNNECILKLNNVKTELSNLKENTLKINEDKCNKHISEIKELEDLVSYYKKELNDIKQKKIDLTQIRKDANKVLKDVDQLDNSK